MRNIKDYIGKYKQSSFENIQVAFRLKKVVEIIQQYRHNAILEIGCGFEPVFKYMDDYENMTIVDPGKEFINNAATLSQGNCRVKCICAFFEDVAHNLLSQSYDFVIISSLLHEVENPANLLQKVKACGGENTVFHMNVPNAYSFHRILAKEMGLIDDIFKKSDRQITLQQNTTFCLESLSELATSVGFQIIDSGAYFIKPFTHEQMHKMLVNNIISESVLDGLYQMTKHMPEYGSEIYINCKLK
jgi:2-polyprenyl-3-methyl-5-hydroxy-6-metoxy-1,4-benzoquinol methylase